MGVWRVGAVNGTGNLELLGSRKTFLPDMDISGGIGVSGRLKRLLLSSWLEDEVVGGVGYPVWLLSWVSEMVLAVSCDLVDRMYVQGNPSYVFSFEAAVVRLMVE